MVRLDVESLPHHFEAVPLKPAVAAVGWAVAILAAAGGVYLAVRSGDDTSEPVAIVLGLLGVLVGFIVVRCRRYEITVGDKRLELATGPFRSTLPAGAVESATSRSATSWRRLYAGDEVVLTVSVSAGEVIAPTREPAELIEALRPDLPDGARHAARAHEL